MSTTQDDIGGLLLEKSNEDTLDVTSATPRQEQSEEDADKLIQLDLGVWSVLMEKAPHNPVKAMNIMLHDLTPLFRLIKDVYSLGRWLFAATLLKKAWASLEPLALLLLSSRLLRIIEIGLRTGTPDSRAIIRAVVLRMATVVACRIMSKHLQNCEMILEGRVQMHFEDFILRNKLKQGLQSPEESEVNVKAGVAWEMVDVASEVATRFVEVAGYLAFLWNLTSSGREGPIFAACCLAKPVLSYLFHPTLWDRAHIMFYGNKDWKHLKSLETLGSYAHREEVITGNLFGYVIKELKRLRTNLKDTIVEYPMTAWSSKTPTSVTIVQGLADDLPLLYYAAYTVLNPAKFSVASIATLQQSTSLIRSTFDVIRWLIQRFGSQILEMKRLYALEDLKSTVKEGMVPYPSQEKEKPTGMWFELIDVSFSYPASKVTEAALKNISCSIKSGQMVVIVGANGSGKSTLIKLLNRLYEPTSGTILVDNHEISSYKMDDYRNAVATLTQDHSIFGISLGENIGLGYPDKVDDEELIMKAAEQGGAKVVLQKFKEGLATSLKPYNYAYGVHVSQHDESPLGRALKKMEKTVNVSGGEKQRIVASRAFMRFESGGISFVAVDEPSSAMDPEAEFQLFKNLRSWRDGKTMIFVTHRFGHLTKHADLILCMKEGSLVESGTHDQLMVVGGEYSKLYKIQAEAFESPAQPIQADSE